MAPGFQAMDVDNGDGNILKVRFDESFISNVTILTKFSL